MRGTEVGSLKGTGSVLGRALTLKRYFWSQKGRVALGTLLLCVAHVVGLWLPMLNRRILDEALPSQDLKQLLVLGGIAALAGVLLFGCTAAKRVVFESAALTIGARIRADLFRKLTRVPYRRYEQWLKGDLQDIMAHDVKSVRVLFLDRIVEAVSSVASGCAAIALMSVLNFGLTAACLVMGACAVGCSMLANRRIHRSAAQHVAKRTALTGAMLEKLACMHLIRMCSTEERESAQFEEMAGQVAGSAVRVERTLLLAGSLTTTAQTVIRFVVFVVGMVLIVRGELLLGELLAFLMYMARLNGTMSRCTSVMWNWQRCKPSLERLVSLFEAPEEGQSGLLCAGGMTGGIEAAGVTVSYGSKDVLVGASLAVPPGAMLAVVGPNGSGKTTLLKVLAGLIEPDEGHVLLGGTPLSQIDMRSYRRICGFGVQLPPLLNRTIRETVSYRLEEPLNSEETHAVLARVGLTDFIQKRPQGLDATLGEMGSRVSGGELQRLSVARELAYGPRFLMLDEATASVDAKGNCEILALLSRVCADSGMSVIFATHAPAALDYADFVCAISDGRIQEVKRVETWRDAAFRSEDSVLSGRKAEEDHA